MSEPKEEISSCTSLFMVNKAFDFSGTTSTNKDSLGKYQNNPPCQNSSFSYILMSELHKKVKSKETNNQTKQTNKNRKTHLTMSADRWIARMPGSQQLSTLDNITVVQTIRWCLLPVLKRGNSYSICLPCNTGCFHNCQIPEFFA